MCAFKPVFDPAFFKFVVPVLGDHEKGFNCITPFEMHPNLQVVACPFDHFPTSVNVWYHYGDILLFDPLYLLVLLGCLSVVVCPLWMLCLWLNLLCRMLRAQGGKWQAYRAFLMCSVSLFD